MSPAVPGGPEEGSARHRSDADRRPGNERVRAGALGAARVSRSGVRWVRAWARRGGAEESGLAALVELVIVHAATDALITLALANTVFFAVPTGEARGRVALYLLTTMAPFALLAPVIGPILDRFRRGRRIAFALTLIGRAALAWVLAGSPGTLELYPLALGVLILSRAFGLTRSAIVPRLLPPGTTLVGANSKISLVTVISGATAAVIGAGVGWLVGYSWTLRVAALVGVFGAFLALALPAHVDSATDVAPPDATGDDANRDNTTGDDTVAGATARPSRHARATRWQRLMGLLPAAIGGACASRALTGFLTLFLAFVLRAEHRSTFDLGLLAVAIGGGSGIGSALGNVLRGRRPQLIVFATLVVSTGVCIAGAVFYTYLIALGVGLVASVSSSLSKLALDSIIQTEVPEEVRASTFARSETALQLAWVLGAAIGLLPVGGQLGVVIASVGMAAALIGDLTVGRRARRRFRAATADPARGRTAPPSAPRPSAAPTRGSRQPAGPARPPGTAGRAPGAGGGGAVSGVGPSGGPAGARTSGETGAPGGPPPGLSGPPPDDDRPFWLR